MEPGADQDLPGRPQGSPTGGSLLLAVTTGIRRGEVLGLRWRDIDFKQGRRAVRQTLGLVNYKLSFGTPKAMRSRQTISIDPATLAALSNQRIRQRVEKTASGATYHDQDLAFAKPDGSPTNPDYYSQCFDRTVNKLPVPRIHLHDLRHTHATLGLQAGVPAKIMSERLGHVSVGFTLDIYTHVIPGHDQDAANQVAGLILDIQEAALSVPQRLDNRCIVHSEATTFTVRSLKEPGGNHGNNPI